MDLPFEVQSQWWVIKLFDIGQQTQMEMCHTAQTIVTFDTKVQKIL